MSKQLPILLLVIGTLALATKAQTEVPLNARLTHVKVYANRAALTTTASTDLAVGNHLLVFSGLSKSLMPQSITCSGTGTGIIQSVTYRTSYMNRTPKTPRMLQLEDSTRILKDLIEGLSNREFVYQQEEQLVLKNNQTASENKGATAEELIKLSNFYRERLSEIRAALFTAKRQKEDYNKRIGYINAQLNEIKKGRDQATHEVVVSYQAKAYGKITLTLNYMVGGANWVPKYDVRVSKVGEPIMMQLKSDVYNTTGVDWQGVRLSLSTANPALGGNPPTLSPQYLSANPPPSRDKRSYGAAKRSAPSGAGAAATKPQEGAADSDELGGEAEEAPAMESSAEYTATVESALSLDYDIAIAHDVPTDGKPHQVDINQFTLPATYTYFAIPKLDKDAFLRAMVGGWDQYNLLPGKANVYFEGSFLTETELNPQETRDTLPIGLGRDPRIVIKRERVRDYSSKKLIGTRTTETAGYTIEIRNSKKEAIQLIVEDQIPVSRSSEIEVKLLEGATGVYHNLTTGKLTWKLTLNAGETKKLTFQYEVKYPKDRPPYGL